MAVLCANTCEEQAQVVVNFGDRANGRTRILARTLLLNGNRRREPLDQVDLWLLHLAKELACIRRETLYVAALSFGIEGVKG